MSPTAGPISPKNCGSPPPITASALPCMPPAKSAPKSPTAPCPVSEETDYPFEDTVNFTVSTPQESQFPLYLRIPALVRMASVCKVNGKAVRLKANPL